ncbi:MAG: sodium:calcium antiporter, partial [Myxococcota bacterium]
MSGFWVTLEFITAFLVIAVAGSQLSRWGDVIGRKTRLGGTWVGLVLLATVTSLPELITAMSAVGLAETADIAVGTILGSCVFNLMILVILDFLLGAESMFSRVSNSHLLSAGFGLILIGLVGMNLMFDHTDDAFSFGSVGLATPLIVVIYVMAVRSVYLRELPLNGADQEPAPFLKDTDVPMITVYIRFAIAAVVVVAAGLWLPFVGERMSISMGIHETFIGTFFIAFATSVPEMVVAIAALRIGAPNMALSNLLGSNLFNILILVPADLLFVQ